MLEADADRRGEAAQEGVAEIGRILDRAVDRRHVELVARRHHGNAHAPDSHLHRPVIIELLLEEAPLRRDRVGLRRRAVLPHRLGRRLEELSSELQSLMRTSYAVFCLKKNRYSLTHLTPLT